MFAVSVVMEVNGLHCDVRVTGVLFGHDSANVVMGNVKVVREGLVLKVLNRSREEQSRAIFPQCVL